MAVVFPTTPRSLASSARADASARVTPRRISRSVPIAGLTSSAHIAYLPALWRGPETTAGSPADRTPREGRLVRSACFGEADPGYGGVRLFGCDHLLGRHDRRVRTVLGLGHELHRAGDEREEGVVLAHAHAGAGPELGAALAHDDRAGVDRLATELLHAETAARGVAAVAGRTTGFFVSHCVLLSLPTARLGAPNSCFAGGPITRPRRPSWRRPSWQPASFRRQLRPSEPQ